MNATGCLNTTMLLVDCISFTDFRLSWRLIIDVNYVLEMLLFMDVGSIAYVSEVHSDSIFRIDPEGGGSMYVSYVKCVMI
jgi:hypothetical protein